MTFTRVKIVTYVPHEDADKVRCAMGEAGAGNLGEYSHCSFSTSGVGRYLPSDKASPHIGRSDVAQSVDEQRIEYICERDKAKAIIDAMIENHPYEEVAYDVYPLVEYEDL